VRARRWTALAALAALALPFFTRLIYPLDLLNPDTGGYVAGGLCAGVALVWIATATLPRRLAWTFVPLLALAAPRFDPGHRRTSRTAEATAREMLREVPAGGTMVYSNYAAWFTGEYLRAAEGARPDVALVFRGQVGRDWFRERLATQRPDVAARLVDFPTGFGGPEVRFEPGIEAEQLGALASRLRPVGLTMAVDAPWASVPASAAAFAPVFDAAPAGLDLDARRDLAFLHLEHAEMLLRGPDVAAPAPRALVGWHLDRASALAPGDPVVAGVRRRADEALAAHAGATPVPNALDAGSTR
jgi:hypothetical protein